MFIQSGGSGDIRELAGMHGIRIRPRPSFHPELMTALPHLAYVTDWY